MGSAARIGLAAQQAVGRYRSAGLHRRAGRCRGGPAQEEVAQQVDAIREVNCPIRVRVSRLVTAWLGSTGKEVVEDIQTIRQVQAAAVVGIAPVKEGPGVYLVKQGQQVLLEFIFVDPSVVCLLYTSPSPRD